MCKNTGSFPEYAKEEKDVPQFALTEDGIYDKIKISMDFGSIRYMVCGSYKKYP